MDVKSDKWKGTTGGGNFGQKSLIFLFKHCDVRVGYFFMYLSIPFYLIFGAKARRAIIHYFTKVYDYGKIKSFFKAWKTYNNFGKVMLDRFSIFSGQKSKFHVECDGVELFDELVKSPQGFVLAGSHTGNFEICGYLLKQEIKKIYALVFGGESEVMKRQRFAQLSQNNVEMVAVKDDMSHLFTLNEALENGNIITLPADRIFGSSKSIKCKFGKAEAEFPVGPFAVAAIRNVPVLAVFVFKLSTRNYKIIVRKVECENNGDKISTKKRAEILAKNFVKLLENQILKNETQWFNFYEFFN
ncbi:MAG: acyltransferase [Bacteroidales bacterium]|nr:acyltransferase [Bacteroidales bacterium]